MDTRCFTIWGFVHEPSHLLAHRLAERLHIAPPIVDLAQHRFFFHTSYGDVAETEQAFLLKLGFCRTPGKTPLSSRQILEQGHASPRQIDWTSLRGNALLACFDKTRAAFVASKNLVSQPQLYYWASGDELIASDSLRCLIEILDQVQVDPDIIPFHLIVGHAPGPLTYLHHVRRLPPGCVLLWQEGDLQVRQVQDLRFASSYAFERVDARAVGAVYDELSAVVGAYVDQIQAAGQGFANLLSGGVDSTLLQLLIAERCAPAPQRSASYALAGEPCFDMEIRYARQAAAVFQCEHTFVEWYPPDYPHMLVRTIETLAQPMITHIEPCKLFLASALAGDTQVTNGRSGPPRYYFTGQGADILFGSSAARKLRLLELLRHIPGAWLGLSAGGRLLRPIAREQSQMLLHGADILSQCDDPERLTAPVNTINTHIDLNTAVHYLGFEAVAHVLKFRRYIEQDYLGAAGCTEQVHVLSLLNYLHEIEAQSGQLFLAHGLEQIYPFMDDDVVRISLAFRPEARYIRGLRSKPALKTILDQHGLARISRQRKGGSGFHCALRDWMQSGPLREMVEEIERPGFMSRGDFDRVLRGSSELLWSLLTFDLFQKHVLRARRP